LEAVVDFLLTLDQTPFVCFPLPDPLHLFKNDRQRSHFGVPKIVVAKTACGATRPKWPTVLNSIHSHTSLTTRLPSGH
jgi:hypothetical protein